MNDELPTKVITSLIKSKALAGSTWKPKNGGAKRKITGYGRTGADVLVNYRLCTKDSTGNLKESALPRPAFLTKFTLEQSI